MEQTPKMEIQEAQNKQPIDKFGLTIDEQIKHLKENKNVHFGEYEEDAKKYLLKHSYADVITPLKVLFSSGYCEERKCHLYDNITKWKDIKRIHQELQSLELTLLQASLNLELELKSLFCVWLSDLLENEKISFNQFLRKLENEITEQKSFFDIHKKKYAKIYKRDFEDYGNTFNKRWWLLIMSMSFGDLCILLSAKLNEQKLLTFIKPMLHIKFKKNLDIYTINALRNSLAHNTNILIFLDKPFRTNELGIYDMRIKAIKTLLKYSSVLINTNSIIYQYKLMRNIPENRTSTTLKV